VKKNGFDVYGGFEPLKPPSGDATASGTRVRPHANFGVNRPADCREIVGTPLIALLNYNVNYFQFQMKVF